MEFISFVSTSDPHYFHFVLYVYCAKFHVVNFVKTANVVMVVTVRWDWSINHVICD